MKIICIGRNYRDHAKELQNPIPTSPLVFMKPASALLIENRPFYIPEFTQEVHYELEVVLKICKNGRHVQPEFASGYYDQISLGIDFTARDLQTKLKEKGHPWEKAKAFDHSAALGKFIPIEEVDKDSIHFQLTNNGTVVQKGDTADLIFPFDHLICHISQYFKLQMGDLIYTGTPAGVGPVTIGDQLVGLLEERELISCLIK